LVQLYGARRDSAAEEIAYHFEQAGDVEAIVYLWQALQQARDLYVYQHAVQLCSRALRMLDVHQHDDLDTRFDWLLAREALLDRQGRRAEQAEDVAELGQIAKETGNTGRLAIANVRAAGLASSQSRYDVAREAGQRALALYRGAGDSSGEAQALRELGFSSWAAGDYGSALSYVRAALQLHRRRGDVEGEATALHNLAEIHRSLGSPRQALGQYEAAMDLYWASQDQQRQGLTLYGMAHALRQVGDVEGALVRCRQALAHCEAAGDRLMASRVHHALAGIYWEAGSTDEAFDHLRQAADTSREIGYGPGIAHGLVALSDLEAQREHVEIARQHLAEAITWLRLAEDDASLTQAQDRLHALEARMPTVAPLFSPQTSWVKSHITLAEGKVYCAFESPLACGDGTTAAQR
jgi:tetratricopeptide (TPR) repeat protein